MKAFPLQTMLAMTMIAGVAWPASAALAEDSPVTLSPPVNGYSPKLSYSMSQIVRLSQAKVSDDIMMAFIRKSESGHGLDAGQIIYLRQHGISDPVILTMLNFPKPAEAAPATPQVQPAVPAIRHAPDPTVTSAPPVMDDRIETTPAQLGLLASLLFGFWIVSSSGVVFQMGQLTWRKFGQ